MADELDIVALVGSLRRDSWNRRVLAKAAESAPTGVEIELVELSDIPPYDQDVEDAGEPAPVRALKERIANSDGVIVNTPEYNLGISGVVKNAIDWVSRPAFAGPLLGKPATVVAVTPGRGGATRAAAQARLTAEICGAVMMAEPDLVIGKLSERVDGVELGADVVAEIDGHVRRFAEFVAATLSAEQS